VKRENIVLVTLSSFRYLYGSETARVYTYAKQSCSRI
jgi:hypothetical protein